MNARLERKLRLLGAIVVASLIGAIAFTFAQGDTSLSALARAISYGLILGLSLGGVSQFVLEGPMRMWLGGLSFTADMVIRSAVYAAVILPT
jgi:adenylate cyclase